MTHAVIYDRASTTLQKDNFSRVNAKDVGIRIAEQNDFTWEYVKEIGSGTTLTGRPEMMKILDRIAANEIQVIIVQDLDRLARPEEAVVYGTIRQVIMNYNVIIYTHTSRIDLNNDDDDFVADITMSVAKKERRRILKRMKRGRVARAESGFYAGGSVSLGYQLVYKNHGESKAIADYAIEPNEAKLVKIIFNTLEDTGGNIGSAAKALNAMGYKGKKGHPFVPNSIKRIVNQKLYIGILDSSITDKVIHRPDLQIISVNQFEQVQELIKSRAGNSIDMGRRGKYIFTGFIVCGNCGGPMVAGNSQKHIFYQCRNRRLHASNCVKGKTYTEHLILPPIIEFLAWLIQNQIDFRNNLDTAAAQYGKSITEEAIEASVQGELASVQAGKQRIVEAISLGILANAEAAAQMEKLREQEKRLKVELSTIAEKTAILAEWQEAVEALKGQDITSRLYKLAEDKPIAFRRLLSLIFRPNSLRVRTERKGNKWFGVLEDYELTQVMQNECISFGSKQRI